MNGFKTQQLQSSAYAPERYATGDQHVCILFAGLNQLSVRTVVACNTRFADFRGEAYAGLSLEDPFHGNVHINIYKPEIQRQRM
jgi:hypothetical protein